MMGFILTKDFAREALGPIGFVTKYVSLWDLFQPEKLLERCGLQLDLITKYVP
jgi:hypothetical protein